MTKKHICIKIVLGCHKTYIASVLDETNMNFKLFVKINSFWFRILVVRLAWNKIEYVVFF